jgi:type II secretory pathway component PulF
MQSASGIVFDPAWRKSLRDWASRHREGVPMTELVSARNAPDRLLITAFTEEITPAEAFTQLAEVYQRRAEYAAARWRTLWQISASVFMFLIVGTAIITLFEPLVAILNSVGASVQ